MKDLWVDFIIVPGCSWFNRVNPMLNTQLPKFIDISTIYHPGSVAFITLEGDEGKGKKVLKWISELKHELVHESDVL